MKQSEGNIQTVFGSISGRSYNILRLGFYSIMIIGSHMAFAVYYQKIFKTPYSRTNSSKGIDGEVQSDYFQNPFTISLFIFFFCYLISLLTQQKNQQRSQEQSYLPWYEGAKIATANVLATFLCAVATILSSFIAVCISTSCELIAVVLLAVFFSKVSSRFKVEKRQIFISALMCLGVIIFAYFDQNESEESSNKPLGWLSGLLLFIELFAYALRQEFFAQVRDKYSISTSVVTCQVSKYAFIITLITCAFTTELWKTFVFIWQHDQIALDLSISGFSNAFGLIFCYRASLQYKQHILPTISTIRKLFSLILSAILFHHNLNGIQYTGIAFVFSSVLIEIYMRKSEESQKQSYIQKQKQTQQLEEPYQQNPKI